MKSLREAFLAEKSHSFLGFSLQIGADRKYVDLSRLVYLNKQQYDCSLKNWSFLRAASHVYVAVIS
jgi:hypothetical protein